VYGLLVGKRLDGWTAIFLVTTVLNEPDRFSLPIRAPFAIPCDWYPIAVGARDRDSRALLSSLGTRLAMDLRCLRSACSLSECLRCSSAGFLEGARLESVGSDTERAAILACSTRHNGAFHRARHSCGEEVSHCAGCHRLISSIARSAISSSALAGVYHLAGQGDDGDYRAALALTSLQSGLGRPGLRQNFCYACRASMGSVPGFPRRYQGSYSLTGRCRIFNMK